MQRHLAALDMIESMIFKPTPIKSRSKAPTNIRKIFFDNKGVELINLPRILHDRSVFSTLPSNIKIGLDIPTAVYYLVSINISNLEIPTFLRDNTTLICNGGGS